MTGLLESSLLDRSELLLASLLDMSLLLCLEMFLLETSERDCMSLSLFDCTSLLPLSLCPSLSMSESQFYATVCTLPAPAP